jgi:hypothetical protein
MSVLILRSNTPVAQFTSALRFPSNSAAGSNIQLVWDSTNFLSRTAHTILWRYRVIQQTGYYAWWWHGYFDGSFHQNEYEFGTHPYPHDTGALEPGDGGNRSNTGATGSAGTIHYQEIAGLGAKDCLSSTDSGSVFLVPKDSTWRWAARQCEVVGGTTLRHRYYVDLSNTSNVIVQDKLVANLPANSTPTLWFGSSDWTASGNTNEEAASGDFNGIQMYSSGSLSAATLQTLAGLTSDAQVIAANPGSLFYCNMSPSHTDVADKSGSGHDPRWANANRPSTLSL